MCADMSSEEAGCATWDGDQRDMNECAILSGSGIQIPFVGIGSQVHLPLSMKKGMYSWCSLYSSKHRKGVQTRSTLSDLVHCRL